MNSTPTFPQQFAATSRFSIGAPRNLAVSVDGAQVFFLRSQAPLDPTLCLWRLDIASGTEILIVDPHQLESAEHSELPPEELARRERTRESGAGIVGYTLSADYKTAVFTLQGALYSVEVDTGVLTALPPQDGVFDPRVNNTGATIAYVKGQDLRVLDLAGSDRLLLSDPDPLVSWGRAEFIAGEEMGRTRGYWWAPDGQSLLATRVDESPIEQRWISDPANPASQPRSTRYPEAGTPNATVDLALVKLDASTSLIDWRQGRYEYLANVIWASGKPPLLVRQTRDQKELSIAEIDLDTLEVSEIRRITDEYWVELVPGSPTMVNAGLLTVEDLAEADTRSLCLDGVAVSPPGLQVRAIVQAQGDEVLVTASTDPTEIHLVMISLAGDQPRHLTDEPGTHQACVGGATVVIASSNPLSSGSTTTVADWNDPNPALGQLAKPLQIRNFAQTPVIEANPKFLQLGDSDLASALLLPHDHDGHSPLPVLLDPYGGPHAQRVLKSQNSHLVSQWFANQGFAVLVVDGRGTPGRGPAFERSVWGNLAEPVLQDQITALDAAKAQFPFLDMDRVGIRGWSFGGYLAALAVLRRSDRFHAAIAGAPVTSWGLYDTHYTERYLGDPNRYPDHYRQSDLLDDAEGLDAQLLVIHGLADDNVVAAHTLRLSSSLLVAGKPHQVLPLSGVTHMTPQQVVAQNLLLLQRDFLIEHLGAA